MLNSCEAGCDTGASPIGAREPVLEEEIPVASEGHRSGRAVDQQIALHTRNRSMWHRTTRPTRAVMPVILVPQRARCKARPPTSHIPGVVGPGARPHPGSDEAQEGRRCDTNVTDTSPITATAANA